MNKFNYIEFSILKSLRNSLHDSYKLAADLFPVASEFYLAVIQRLTNVDPFSLGSEKASATVAVTDFVSERHQAAINNLSSDLENSFENSSEIWVTVSMLASEGLVAFVPQKGILLITRAGLTAIRSGQVRDD